MPNGSNHEFVRHTLYTSTVDDKQTVAHTAAASIQIWLIGVFDWLIFHTWMPQPGVKPNRLAPAQGTCVPFGKVYPDIP
jgi:hypothetical protein